MAECLDGRRVPINSAERADRQGRVPYWGANSIVDFIDEALFDEDLVLLGEDGAPFFDSSKPVAFFSQGPIWPNNHVHVLRSSTCSDSRYLVHVLNVTDYSAFIDGSTRDKLTQGEMGKIPIPWPALAEQEAISSFLDAETSKIDALVVEQRRLIELLKEKRQAVISHAVTKGLNPNAPMKPSGIAWLGDVPEHWVLTRLKHLAHGFMYGTSADCNLEDDGVPVLRIPNIKTGFIDFTDLKFANFTPDAEARYLLRKNDILVVRTNGNPKLVGKSALFTSKRKSMFASYLIKIRPSKNVDPAYLNIVMNASCTREMLTLSARTSAGNYNLNCEGLGRTAVALPPIKEQQEIVQDLEQRLNSIVSLKENAEQAISLLQERRTALISAAVTGKIDVRYYQPDEAA